MEETRVCCGTCKYWTWKILGAKRYCENRLVKDYMHEDMFCNQWEFNAPTSTKEK